MRPYRKELNIVTLLPSGCCPDSVTSSRSQPSYPQYFGFTLVQWKEVIHLYLCQWCVYDSGLVRANICFLFRLKKTKQITFSKCLQPQENANNIQPLKNRPYRQESVQFRSVLYQICKWAFLTLHLFDTSGWFNSISVYSSAQKPPFHAQYLVPWTYLRATKRFLWPFVICVSTMSRKLMTRLSCLLLLSSES